MPAGTTLSPSVWFREIILPQIENLNKTEGDYLEGTMRVADQEAGLFKFPIMSGAFQMYKLTGAIQPVAYQSLGLDYVSLQPDDFEASGYLRTQDLDRIGPAMQAEFAAQMSKAVAKKKDTLKLDALSAFMSASTPPDTIGSGASDVIDIIDIIRVGAELRRIGYREPIFLPVPEMWFAQLMMYKEFANADYVGPTDMPFAKAEATQKRTYQGVNIFTMPEEYFDAYAPGSTAQYTWAWVKSSMGAQTGKELRNPTFVAQPQMEGSPWLAKVNISGAALGINSAGVKRLYFKKLTEPVRPT